MPSCAYPPFGICYACSPPRARVTRKAVVSVALIKGRPLWRFLSYRGARALSRLCLRLGFCRPVCGWMPSGGSRAWKTLLRTLISAAPLCSADATFYGRCAFCFFSHVVASVSRVWSDGGRTTSRDYSLPASQLVRPGVCMCDQACACLCGVSYKCNCATI